MGADKGGGAEGAGDGDGAWRRFAGVEGVKACGSSGMGGGRDRERECGARVRGAEGGEGGG